MCTRMFAGALQAEVKSVDFDKIEHETEPPVGAAVVDENTPPNGAPVLPEFPKGAISLVIAPNSKHQMDMRYKPALLQRRPQASPLSTLQQRRKTAFKGQLSINCQELTEVTNQFAQSQCRQIDERYYRMEAVGQGTTGVVYRARSRAADREVALKVMRMDDEEMLRTAQQEYDLLRSVEHPYIVRAVDFFTFTMGAVLVLEYYDGRDLESAVLESRSKALSEKTAQTLFSKLMQAVGHLHEKGIMHRDVKASNILVSADATDLRLVDFNTARRVREGALTLTGTPDYLPPEVLLGDSLSEGSDIWAAGVCLHFMLAGSLPLERRSFSSHAEFGRAVQGLVGGMPSSVACHKSKPRWSAEGISEDCKAVLGMCLTVDPQHRPTADEVLATDWLRAAPCTSASDATHL